MAWYAECVRRNWPYLLGCNMIYIYREHLYDEWYASLTDEQKQRLEEQKRRKAEKTEREFKQALQSLAMMNAICAGSPYSYVNDNPKKFMRNMKKLNDIINA